MHTNSSFNGNRYVLCCMLSIQNYSVRRDMGDFMIGAFMAQELSNPFQSMAMILRMVG